MTEYYTVSKAIIEKPQGHYQYLKMPYGLPKVMVYQRVIIKTLRSYIDCVKVLTYNDGIIILPNYIVEDFEILRGVLQIFTAAEMADQYEI